MSREIKSTNPTDLFHQEKSPSEAPSCARFSPRQSSSCRRYSVPRSSQKQLLVIDDSIRESDDHREPLVREKYHRNGDRGVVAVQRILEDHHACDSAKHALCLCTHHVGWSVITHPGSAGRGRRCDDGEEDPSAGVRGRRQPAFARIDCHSAPGRSDLACTNHAYRICFSRHLTRIPCVARLASGKRFEIRSQNVHGKFRSTKICRHS